ncbi:MAG: hypothetical protein Q7J35_19430 [Candidatus Methanoperedens sp.]|nr:hypothetical protein [Candidatus Methanoperedens sp.]
MPFHVFKSIAEYWGLSRQMTFIYRFDRIDRIYRINHRTQITRRDMKVASQIAEHATPSIWGNPTVTCVGSNAGV